MTNVQWNLSVAIALGPIIRGCNREVAALNGCIMYGVLALGAWTKWL